MGNLHLKFCTAADGDYLHGHDGWVIIENDTNSLLCSGANCEVYKKSGVTGTIQARNLNVYNYHAQPRYFSASIEMKRGLISDRGIFGFFISKSENCEEYANCATSGGLALYGYDDDNTDLYYMAWDTSNGGCSMQWAYLVNLESIGIDPYVYHTYRFMADLQEGGSYGYYDGVTIDDIGTVCPPHDVYGKLNMYACGNEWNTDIHMKDEPSDAAWRGRNITIYNITGDKNYNKFPKWRKTSAGMRPTY